MKPSIGRIVIYNTKESLRQQLKGYDMKPLLQYPAIIISVSSNPEHTKNETTLHVLHNIPTIQGALVVEDCQQGDEENQWNWPQITK